VPGAQVVQAAQVLALHPAVPAQVQALPLQAVPALAPAHLGVAPAPALVQVLAQAHPPAVQAQAHLGVAPAPAPALVQVQVLAQAHPPAAQAQVLHLQVAQVQALPLQAAPAQVLHLQVAQVQAQAPALPLQAALAQVLLPAVQALARAQAQAQAIAIAIAQAKAPPQALVKKFK
jgi:hypothetical protein